MTFFVYKCLECGIVVCCEDTAEEMERKKKEHDKVCPAKEVKSI